MGGGSGRSNLANVLMGTAVVAVATAISMLVAMTWMQQHEQQPRSGGWMSLMDYQRRRERKALANSTAEKEAKKKDDEKKQARNQQQQQNGQGGSGSTAKNDDAAFSSPDSSKSPHSDNRDSCSTPNTESSVTTAIANSADESVECNNKRDNGVLGSNNNQDTDVFVTESPSHPNGTEKVESSTTPPGSSSNAGVPNSTVESLGCNNNQDDGVLGSNNNQDNDVIVTESPSHPNGTEKVESSTPPPSNSSNAGVPQVTPQQSPTIESQTQATAPPAATTILQTLFHSCAEKVNSQQECFPHPLTNGDRLLFYGLYKQATVGNASDASTASVSSWNVVARAKHAAWKKFHDMPPEQAMLNYIEAVTEFQRPASEREEDPQQQNDDDDDDEGTEDEFAALESGMGLRPSRPMMENFDEEEDEDDDGVDGDDDGYEEDGEDDDDDEEEEGSVKHSSPWGKQLQRAASRGDLQQLQSLLLSPAANGDSDDNDAKNNNDAATHDDDDPQQQQQLQPQILFKNVNYADDAGQTALHLAADHGANDCVRSLLRAGANPNAADRDGISVLQAAVIAGHVDTATLLLQAGANPDLPDQDGDTPRSCAQDDGSLAMRELFLKNITNNNSSTGTGSGIDDDDAET